MTDFEKALLREAPGTTKRREADVARWEKRRPWTRTDTARYLNDRSEPLLAIVRRLAPEHAPIHTRQMGYWLRQHAQPAFDRAHARLAALSDDAQRERLIPSELL